VSIYEVSNSTIERAVKPPGYGPFASSLLPSKTTVTFAGRGSRILPKGEQILLMAISPVFTIELTCRLIRQDMRQHDSTIIVEPIGDYTITERK